MKKLIIAVTLAAVLTLVGATQTSAADNEINPFAAVDPGNPGGG